MSQSVQAEVVHWVLKSFQLIGGLVEKPRAVLGQTSLPIFRQLPSAWAMGERNRMGTRFESEWLW